VRTTITRAKAALFAIGLSLASIAIGGCEVDSFFDPSATGRFEHSPTTIPILARIDVIEHEQELWGETTGVMPEDLIPNEVAYKLSPGDVITVQIFELYSSNAWHSAQSSIDVSGFFRVPELGDVQAAGMTVQEFEDRVTRLLDQEVMQEPLVDVSIEASRGLRYTIYGAVATPGMYTLQSSDLRLLDALALGGGFPLSTEKIFVIRPVDLSERTKPRYLQDDAPTTPRSDSGTQPAIDIESLIENLDGDVQPGVLRQDGEPVIDIDELEPIARPDPPTVDVDALGPGGTRPETASPGADAFIFDEQRGEWVKIRVGGDAPASSDGTISGDPALVTERVIEIPFQRLKRGDNSYNIIIRPGDRIYVQEQVQGVVYLDGEVSRRGVYNLPQSGGKLTLSRLVAAAGGLSPLAIPERVDLTRVVGENREATIRLNLAAIRNRTEPDVMLKPDDTIIVGTNFWAVPLAVIRNGFRATYGFGFLLDRNFGNDVFGPPPVNVN
jgi:polysaccharide export outer membrane protein